MSNLSDKILAIDKRIGFVMIVNSEGAIIESKMTGKELMPRDKVANLARYWAAIIRGIVLQMEEYFGRSESVTLSYEKLNVHGFPLANKFIVITSRKDMPLEKVLGVKELLVEA